MTKDTEVINEEPSTTHALPEKRRESFPFGALILIFIGVILLLNNFNILPWSVWGEIWRFWPIIIILAGIQLLVDGSWWVKTLIFFFGLLLLVFAFIYILMSANPTAVQDFVNTWSGFDNKEYYLNIEGI